MRSDYSVPVVVAVLAFAAQLTFVAAWTFQALTKAAR